MGIIDGGDKCIHNLSQIMGWNVTSHTNCNSRCPIYEEVGYQGRQDRGFLERGIVVGSEINRLFVQIGEKLMGQLVLSDFCVSHGRWWISIHRTKVSLTINQGMTHRKMLSHTHKSIIYCGIAMGMILTNDVTDNAGGFFVGLVPVVTQLPHGIEYASVHRLEPIAHIWKGSAYDNAHGIV